MLLDYHFYKLATFLKFCHLVSQFILDILLGFLFIHICTFKTDDLLAWIHYGLEGLHVNWLTQRVDWLMGFPAGYKPNLHLDLFLGELIKVFIFLWNDITTWLNHVEYYIVVVVSFFGLMGFSLQLALMNDIFVIASFHILSLYSVFAYAYKNSLSILGTMMSLFRGRKKNVLRNRIDE